MSRSLWFFPAIVLAMLSLAIPDSRGGWGPMGCAAVAAPVQRTAPPVPVADGWYESSQYRGWTYWVQGGVARCWYEPATGKYQAIIDTRTGALGPVSTPPWEANQPIGAIGQMPDWMTHGVDREKMVLNRERITINGREASKADALDLIGKPGGANDIPDDAKKPRLTLAGGTDADRARVLADLPASMRDSFVIQSYPAGHWALRPGFVSTGNPTVYLQAAPQIAGGTGKVLLRLDRWEGEPSVVALRKTDPSYDPLKDPDGRPKPKPVEPRPEPKPEPRDSGTDPLTIVLLILVVLGGYHVFTQYMAAQKRSEPE